MSTEINQTQASVVASIQSQRTKNVSVQVTLFASSIAKQKFDPQIQSLSNFSTEISSTSAASHRFAAVKTPINKKLRHIKIWVGAPDPKASAEMDVALYDILYINIFPFSFVEDMKKKWLTLQGVFQKISYPPIFIMLVETYSHPSMIPTGIKKLNRWYCVQKYLVLLCLGIDLQSRLSQWSIILVQECRLIFECSMYLIVRTTSPMVARSMHCILLVFLPLVKKSEEMKDLNVSYSCWGFFYTYLSHHWIQWLIPVTVYYFVKEEGVHGDFWYCLLWWRN